MITIREPEVYDKEDILKMVEEFATSDDEILFDGISNFKSIDDNNYENWLIEQKDNERFIKRGYSPQTTYIALDEEENIVGALNLRHNLVGDLINHGGNIGYAIRPSERRKGYASEMLKLALYECKKLKLDKVLITCRKENIASSKVIENNGGICENDYYDEPTKKIYKRYWIKL